MLKNMKIGLRLGLGFGIMMFLMCVIAFIGITRMQEMNSATTMIVKDRWPKSVAANDVIDLVNANARAVRNVVILDKLEEMQVEKERIVANRKTIAERLDWLSANIASTEGKRLLAEVMQARQVYNPALDKTLALAMEFKNEEAARLLLGDLRKAQRAYFDAINGLIKFQGELVESSGAKADATYEVALELIMVLAGIALLLAAVMAILITRSITHPLNSAVTVANSLADGDLTVRIESNSKDETGQLLASMQVMVERLSQVMTEVRASAENLATAAEEIGSTTQSLAQSSSEQAASVEETSAAVEQMSASVSQNADNSRLTDSMAAKASKEAVEGGSAVNDTVNAMKSIASKISIIDDIAYQTNLLALNAAIEAARAGEHGKGFAVVAAEVRKLAERSQVAAQEISELAENSVTMAEKAGSLLAEIVPSINKTSDLVQEIAAASAEQSVGVGQINQAMMQLSQTTQQNASASEQLAATSEELSNQAENLHQLISFFRVADGGASFAIGKKKAKAFLPKSTQKTKYATHAEHDGDFVKF